MTLDRLDETERIAIHSQLHLSFKESSLFRKLNDDISDTVRKRESDVPLLDDDSGTLFETAQPYAAKNVGLAHQLEI
jgi:hypothetical protein